MFKGLGFRVVGAPCSSRCMRVEEDSDDKVRNDQEGAPEPACV